MTFLIVFVGVLGVAGLLLSVPLMVICRVAETADHHEQQEGWY